MGIRDKKLISVIRAILTAPIRMPDGSLIHPQKGTPQGGILSPLLANIVLNELDHWIDGQWLENPVTESYSSHVSKSGGPNKGNAYRAMKKTNLKLFISTSTTKCSFDWFMSLISAAIAFSADLRGRKP